MTTAHLDQNHSGGDSIMLIIIIIIDNFFVVLFSGLHRLPVLYNIFQHLSTLSEKNIKGSMFKKVMYIL